MIKTFKWIYNLGYKHAENKLYHQLMAKVRDTRPDELEMFGLEEKPNYTQKELESRQRISFKLEEAIESVFHPVEPMTPSEILKNRFEL